MSVTIKSNCPRDCYDGCGIVVHVQEGARPRVVGDPDHPVSRGRLCGKCGIAYNGVWQDEAARLGSPLRRVGPKGAGRFEPISWDEALAEVSGKLRSTLDRRGPEAILASYYTGTLSMLAFFFPLRLMHKLGVSQVEYGTICNAAGYAAWELLFGTAEKGFDPRTASESACILVWGANPSHSAPHTHEHWLNDSPARVVVIDPVRTRTAAAADLHLQPRPGTDAALAFALLHELRELNAFDQAFIDEHTLGAEELSPLIDACTAQWGERETGVPAADIRRAAGYYAAGPALLWVGQALQRQPQGGNIMRAAGLLPALTGNIGKPGAGFCYLNETAAIAGADINYLVGAELASAEPARVGALDMAEHLADADKCELFMVWNTNPLASSCDQRKLRAACGREDLFTVVIDCFQTDTARYADIVLPAASFLEFDDLTFSYFNLCIGAQSKVREPIGSSLPNQEIFRRLAAALGLDDEALRESDDAIIERLLEQMGAPCDFAGLQARGHYFLNGERPLLLHEDFKFDTPSGRIEIASDAAVSQGLPRTPRPDSDPPPPAGMIRLLTPASGWRLNDSYGNDPKIAQRCGPASVVVCPDDAARFGLEAGGRARLANEAGEIELTVEVADTVLAGTALSYKGRWPSLEPGGVNVNELHIARKCDMGEGTSIHGTLVSIRPAG